MQLVFVIAVLLSTVDGFRFLRSRRDVDSVVRNQRLNMPNGVVDYQLSSSNIDVYGLPGKVGRIVTTQYPRKGNANGVIRNGFLNQGGIVVPANQYSKHYETFSNHDSDVNFKLNDDKTQFGNFEYKIEPEKKPIVLEIDHHKVNNKEIKHPIQIENGIKVLAILKDDETILPTTINSYDDGLVAEDFDFVDHVHPKIPSKDDDGLENDNVPIGTGAQVSIMKPIKVPLLPFTKKPVRVDNAMSKFVLPNEFSFLTNASNTTTPLPDSSEFIAPSKDSDQGDDSSDEGKNKNAVPVRHVIKLSSKARIIILPDGVVLISLSNDDFNALHNQ